MPAPARYAYVPDQLRELALDAKLRGLSFEEWWHEALPVRLCRVCKTETLMPSCPNVIGFEEHGDGMRTPIECGARTKGPKAPTFSNRGAAAATAVIWPTDANERRAWLGGVDSGREGWRDAYEGRPAERRHKALARIAEGLRVVDAGGNDRELAVA